MIIKKAKPSDLENIFTLYLEFCESEEAQAKLISKNNSEQYTTRKRNFVFCAKKELLEQIKNRKGFFLIATINKKIVGFIYGFIDYYSTKLYKMPGKSGWVHMLHVKKEFRRQGVATKLQAALESWFKKKGCYDSNLSFFYYNNARKFYESLGYSSTVLKMNKKL